VDEELLNLQNELKELEEERAQISDSIDKKVKILNSRER